MLLKQLGFFRELSYGTPDGPSIHERSPSPLSEEANLLQYLRSAVVYLWAPGLENDLLAPEKVIGPMNILTDGVWAWPASLAYYLENYHVVLPQEFLGHVQSRKYIIPDPEEIRTHDLELSG